MSVEQHARNSPGNPSDEPIVGHYFAAPSFERMRTEIYSCDSYDAKVGYLMTNVNDPKDHRGVSIRAIGRTWMEAEDHGDYWWVPLAHVRIDKLELV